MLKNDPPLGIYVLIPGLWMSPYMAKIIKDADGINWVVLKWGDYPGLSWAFLVAQNLPANAGVSGLIPFWEDHLGKEMATHSSILAWEIPWTEEPGGLWSMGSQRVRHDWVIKQQQHQSPNFRTLIQQRFIFPAQVTHQTRLHAVFQGPVWMEACHLASTLGRHVT